VVVLDGVGVTVWEAVAVKSTWEERGAVERKLGVSVISVQPPVKKRHTIGNR
jgi:hypothetical protein